MKYKKDLKFQYLEVISQYMVIFTDGGARPTNPGPGGFGVLVLDIPKNFDYNNFTSPVKVLDCYSKHTNNMTTNNAEEIKAILYSFYKYGVNINNMESTEIPVVYSDSAYAVNTLTQWVFGWAARGWLKSDNKLPENLELVRAFYEHWQNGYRIEIKKIKGHRGIWGNEMADALAHGSITPEEVMKIYG